MLLGNKIEIFRIFKILCLSCFFSVCFFLIYMFVTYEHVQGTQLPMSTEEENGDKREWNTSHKNFMEHLYYYYWLPNIMLVVRELTWGEELPLVVDNNKCKLKVHLTCCSLQIQWGPAGGNYLLIIFTMALISTIRDWFSFFSFLEWQQKCQVSSCYTSI